MSSKVHPDATVRGPLQRSSMLPNSKTPPAHHRLPHKKMSPSKTIRSNVGSRGKSAKSKLTKYETFVKVLAKVYNHWAMQTPLMISLVRSKCCYLVWHAIFTLWCALSNSPWPRSFCSHFIWRFCGGGYFRPGVYLPRTYSHCSTSPTNTTRFCMAP